MTLVSIVMAVHNGERYLSEAVDSIVNQSFRDFEFIIVDDGSSDGSPSLLEAYAKCDNRIRIITQANQGLAVALNNGIRIAQGKLIARMDADDISYPIRLGQQVSFLRRNPEVICCGTQVRLIDHDGDVIGLWSRPFASELIQSRLLAGEGGLIVHPTMMIRKESLMRLGLYDERYTRGQDFDLLLRLSEIGRLANLDQILLDWRQHPSNASATASIDQFKFLKQSLSEAYQRRGIALAELPSPPDFTRKTIADFHMMVARTALSNGNGAVATKHARLALTGLNRFKVDWLEMKAISGSGVKFWLSGLIFSFVLALRHNHWRRRLNSRIRHFFF